MEKELKDFYPKVSIVIPVYNGSKYLREAVDSALNQTYKNIEVIVVNDGSNDEGKTEQIAQSYGAKIKYYAKENGGVSTALNLGIEKMTGDYFSWLSHDDVYYTNKIEVQIDFLRKLRKPETALYSDFVFIDSNSEIISEKKINPDERNNSLYSVFRSLINGCTLLIPKSFFNKVGMFNEKLKSTQDYDLWFRMFKLFPIVHIPELLVKYRTHPEQGGLTIINHSLECDNLYVNIMENVTDDEVKTFNKDISHFYIETAVYLKKVCYYKAAERSYERYLNKNKKYIVQEIVYKYVYGRKWWYYFNRVPVKMKRYFNLA